MAKIWVSFIFLSAYLMWLTIDPIGAIYFSTKKEKEMPQKIVIYSTKVRPYCVQAKKLLDTKNVAYEEIDVSNNDSLRKTMTEKANGRTSVPQIFIGNHHVGGFDDLNALHQQGKLDELLS